VFDSTFEFSQSIVIGSFRVFSQALVDTFLLLTLFLKFKMSIVGLDFGNLSVLIGQASRGGVDVILNDSSNRQTASYVSIQGKQRFLGDSGAAMVSVRRV
jgi:hypothetical protein